MRVACIPVPDGASLRRRHRNLAAAAAARRVVVPMRSLTVPMVKTAAAALAAGLEHRCPPAAAAWLVVLLVVRGVGAVRVRVPLLCCLQVGLRVALPMGVLLAFAMGVAVAVALSMGGRRCWRVVGTGALVCELSRLRHRRQLARGSPLAVPTGAVGSVRLQAGRGVDTWRIGLCPTGWCQTSSCGWCAWAMLQHRLLARVCAGMKGHGRQA